MADIIITESDMEFGPFPDTSVFRLEESSIYTDIFRQDGIKTCEFVLQKGKTIYFVEAKTSCPNYSAAQTSEEKRKKYEEYIHDISQKMLDSLNMYMSTLLNRNHSTEFQNDMRQYDLGDYKIRFILVVKNAEASWLETYPAQFQARLRNVMTIWGIPSFGVLTENAARMIGLISDSTQSGTPETT